MPAPLPGERIFGVETEFGCLVQADSPYGQPEDAVEAIKDHVFLNLKLGLIDLHARDDVFEPARSGGFLINGGRLYIDAVGSHLEYATAECRDLKNLIANDRAGQRIIVRALRELGIQDSVSVYNNSVDHFGGHTFGCHENFLVRMEENFFSHEIPRAVAFFVTRQIFAGVGRVGGHVLTNERRPKSSDIQANPIDYIWVSNAYGVEPDESVDFQLSQRADHILKVVASRVRFNRALINPKWEHFYSHNQHQRFHLLFGESNMMEYAYALKVGTTHLVLRLLEDAVLGDDMILGQPLVDLRLISRDPSFQWECWTYDGARTNAIEVQRFYHELCTRYAGESPQTDWILHEWAKTLDQLARDPMELGDKLDWVAKRKIVEQYRSEEGLDWNDDALHAVDLEYHNIDPDRGLFYALQEMGETARILDDLDITDAMTDPPSNTRASLRAAKIRDLMKRERPRAYAIDWNGVAFGRHDFEEYEDPYRSASDAALEPGEMS